MTTTPKTRAAHPVRRGNPWLPTPRGVALVTRIELLRRRPTTKGYILYGMFFAAIVALGILVSVASNEDKTSVPLELVLVLVLGAGFLIGPSLSATSINGDSGEGVLAPLQMARLTAGDLAVGKLIAAWAVSIAALVTTTPFLVHAFSRSGWTFLELLPVLGAILLFVLMATAVGLAWSALVARTVISISLAHITSGMLTLGTLLMFAFTAPLVSEEVVVQSRDYDWESVTEDQWNDPSFDHTTLACVEREDVWTITHTDRTAWLLLINPLITISELAPLIDPETFHEEGRAAPGIFAIIHQQVSGSRLGPEEPRGYDGCTEWVDDNSWEERQRAAALMDPAPLPGLGLGLALLVVSMGIAIQRLRVPYRTLRTGSRVA